MSEILKRDDPKHEVPRNLFRYDRVAWEFEQRMRKLVDEPQTQVVLHKFVQLLGMINLTIQQSPTEMHEPVGLGELYNWLVEEGFPKLASWMRNSFRGGPGSLRIKIMPAMVDVICDGCIMATRRGDVIHTNCDGVNARYGGEYTDLPCSCPSCLQMSVTEASMGIRIGTLEST